MTLEWYADRGTWNALERPASLVHGIAFIRGAAPNICLYATAGSLRLQVGVERFPVSADTPRILCRRDLASFGLRRRFLIESAARTPLFSQAYWAERDRDFFSWLAQMAADGAWRSRAALEWSDGVAPDRLRGLAAAGREPRQQPL